MIEFQQGKDRLRFKKRNAEIAIQAEIKAEHRRVEMGIIPEFRLRLIQKVSRADYKPPRD